MKSRLLAYLLILSLAEFGGATPQPNETLVNLPDNTWQLISKGDVTSNRNIGAYSGAWFDLENGQLCIFGGGHWDYAGNEIWAFDINTLEWRLLEESDPVEDYENADPNYPGALFSPAGEGIETTRPLSRHSYDQMEWVGDSGAIVYGGYNWGDGGQVWCDTCRDTWSFDFETNSWEYRRLESNLTPSQSAGDSCAAYVPDEGLLYTVVGLETWTYDPDQNLWAQISTTGSPPYAIESSLVYDSRRNELYHFGGMQWPNVSQAFWKFDLATRVWSEVSPIGDGPVEQAYTSAALDYDPVNDIIAVYSGGRIWIYDIQANAWSESTPNGEAPTGDGRTFGRFRYDPFNNGFWYHDTYADQGQETWFYKYRTGANPDRPGLRIASIDLENQSNASQDNVPVTFGHVFKRGDAPANTSIQAQATDGTDLQTQVDAKAYYPDGSLKHATLSLRYPLLESGESVRINLNSSAPQDTQDPVELSELLNTDFDVVATLEIDGEIFTASARDQLQTDTTKVWLRGPIATEWTTAAPLRNDSDQEHPHLSARFEVRAYSGFDTIRVGLSIENTWSRVESPRNYSYNIDVVDSNGVELLSENAITHFRQSRWRRLLWLGQEPDTHLSHDSEYLTETGSVPRYDPRLSVSADDLDQMASEFGTGNGIMEIGSLRPNMTAPGGEPEIAPLPRFAARYLISQDARAKAVTLGHGEQSGTWSMHYRDRDTDLPISIDTYPEMTIVGSPEWFPGCSVDCETPFTYDLAHHPSLAYLPYLISGDYFYLEELMFWANLATFYNSADMHGLDKGYVAGQVRSQAWSLRTLGQAAYITPDDHSLKNYFNEKLSNNIAFFQDYWVDSNPLGYIQNRGPRSLPESDIEDIASVWMDDFLTWSFGHLVELGFEEVRSVLHWKSEYVVGRMTNPDTCRVLAPANWLSINEDIVYNNGSDAAIDTWEEWRIAAIRSWDNSSFTPEWLRDTFAGRVDEMIAAQCSSQQMADLLGVEVGRMIGYQGAQGYAANMQPALAVAYQSGIDNAIEAWEAYARSINYPDYSSDPQWAIVPRGWQADAEPPNPDPNPDPEPEPDPDPDLSLSIDYPAQSFVVPANRFYLFYSYEGELPDGSKIELSLDDRPFKQDLLLDGRFFIEASGSGEHSVAGRIVDQSGQIIILSETVTFTTSLQADTSLVLSVGFEDDTGDDQIMDVSSFSNHGQAFDTSRIIGRHNNGLEIQDGQYLEFPDSESLDIEGSLTISAWVNPTRLEGWQTIAHKTSDGSASNYYFDTQGTGLEFGFRDGDWQSLRAANLALALQQWQHVAVSYDSQTGSTTFYLNGVASSTQTLAGSLTPNADPLLVGRRYDGEQFLGGIDELRIYDRALEAGEIIRDMHTPIAGLPSKDIDVWKLEYGLDLQQSNDSDNDLDALPLALEFALGMNPLLSDGHRAFLIEQNETEGRFDLRYTQIRDGVSIQAEWSEDLRTWQSEGIQDTETILGQPSTVSFQPATANPVFIRLIGQVE